MCRALDSSTPGSWQRQLAQVSMSCALIQYVYKICLHIEMASNAFPRQSDFTTVFDLGVVVGVLYIPVISHYAPLTFTNSSNLNRSSLRVTNP
jgi:hypothetical protein